MLKLFVSAVMSGVLPLGKAAEGAAPEVAE